MNDIKDFIKKNSACIYEYINTEVLKDIGVMNPDYFEKIVQELFIENNEYEVTPNLLPYFIFTIFSNNGKIDYTSLRVESINFSQINQEALTYYNYARFTLKNDFLWVELMQSKIGGMPIDADIVKYTKKISIKHSGLAEFIKEKEAI